MSLPGIPDSRKSEKRPAFPGTPRMPAIVTPSQVPDGAMGELILTRLAEVEERFTLKLDSYASDTDKRLVALERQALREGETALAVQQLTSAVNVVLERDRKQDLDIGALSARVEAVTRPVVTAVASAAGSAEGTLAGADAGKRSARVIAIVGAILTAVACGVLQHCEQQIANYQAIVAAPVATPAPTASVKWP